MNTGRWIFPPWQLVTNGMHYALRQNSHQRYLHLMDLLLQCDVS